MSGQLLNVQTAPWPAELENLVHALDYKPGYEIHMAEVVRGQGSIGLTLVVTTCTEDAYHPEVERRVAHYFPVPPASYDRRSWQRWLFDRLLLVETHEAMEFFQIGDARPYAPSHGPGNDPYLIREVGTRRDVETSFRGEYHGDDDGTDGGEL